MLLYSKGNKQHSEEKSQPTQWGEIFAAVHLTGTNSWNIKRAEKVKYQKKKDHPIKRLTNEN